ncbi:MAG: glycosyltransferase family 4 protein [Lachnospiraceae bacterium]|nr:glycosyltransferase family 4 protein [Lachnospiraceae bacterium]MDY3223423.1 glycosyltransferase family 4 protein [Lachnospiraceae bacterium]
MERKKIVFYSGNLAKGGAERVIINLATALLAKGHEVVLATSVQLKEEYPVPEGAKRLVIYEKAEDASGNRIVNFVKRYRKQRRIWKEEKPDIIVSFIGKNNAMALLTTLGMKIPVLVSVRGEPSQEYYNRALKLCAKYLFPRAAGIILQTEDSKSFFCSGVLKKAVVLPNPLNPIFVEDEKKPKAEEESKNPKPRRITMMGRVDANKNQKLVIEAFERLAPQFPDYVLEIWGKGEERERLLNEVKEAGLSERIFLPGTTQKVKEKLKASAIYILSSNTEGMPNSLMEAMAMGLPVISTDCPCGGPRTLITHGVNGLLVPVGDVEAMTAAMRQLMENEKFAQELGEKALEIRKTLDPVRVNRKWEEYILSCCQG